MNIDNLSSSLKEQIQSNAELKSFIHNIEAENQLILSKFTHELRNPLTLIRSTIQLIENQHPEVKDFKYWDQLLSDVDDTVNITNELSVYNHCDQLSLNNTDLNELVLSTLESMKPFAASHNLSIKYHSHIGCDQLSSFVCDKVKLKEVLTNLMKNAIEAAEQESIITVDLSMSPGTKTTGHYINIAITNSGFPIPRESLDRIFEPFFTSKQNGSGLGLAISQKIAQMHGGQLTVSQTDSAVTFTLQLPMNVIAGADSPL